MSQPLTSVRPTSTRRATVPRWTRRLMVPVAVVVGLQAISMLGLADPRLIPPPSDVVLAGIELVADGRLGSALAISAQRAGIGLLLGGSIGAVLGLLAGLRRRGEDLIDPTAQMIRTIPNAGMVGLFILWFGIGESAKVAIVAAGTFFPIYLHVFAGVREVDQRVVDAARTLGLRGPALTRHVVLPAAVPQLLVGLRQSLSIAWLSLLFAEQINAQDGIGWLINRGLEAFRVDMVWVVLITYALLGFAIFFLVKLLERVLLSWRDGYKGA